jgi:hypothetical protein
MPKIISSDQLTGRFQVTQNVKNVTNIEEYIDSIEKPLIIKIMGATLGTEFWDDLDVDGVPQTAKFLTLYEPFDFDNDGNDCGCGIKSSKGLVEILRAVVYAQYTRDADSFNTDIGNQTIQGENSNRVNPSAKIVKAYNEAVESMKAIQWYIEDHSADYENYNGQHIGYWMLF